MYGSIQKDNANPTTTAPTTTTTTSSSRPSMKSFLQFTAMALAGVALAAAGVQLFYPTSQASFPTLSTSREMTSDVSSSSSLGKRGQGLKPVRDDAVLFVKGAADAYDPIENPDGYLVLLVAENKLMWHEMAHKIELVQEERPLPEWVFTYGAFGGDAAFKKGLANMMHHWIHAPIDPDFMRVQAGAGSVLDQLSYIIADPDDGVLVPGPGYSAFAGDFNVYGSAKVHIAHTKAENMYAPTLDELEDSYQRAMDAGNPPKIFVICQPNNPTGTIYPKDVMEFMVSWALDKGLHIVSDEIYALSTFPGYHTVSAADIMAERNPDSDQYLGDYVHIVAGLSKDWGMSGLRVGTLFTHNKELLQAFDLVGYYQTVSSYTQHALTGVFEDEDFVDWYIGENRKRLHEQYLALGKALDLIDVPLYPSHGAIFAWADFSAYLKEGQTEKELWMELFDDAKIAFTSGESMYGDKPGLFRIVYGWPEGGVEAMEELGRRLVAWKAGREDTSTN